MVFSRYDGIRIAGIAAAVPEREINMESLKETEDPQMIENFIKKTGIKKIHKGYPNQTAGDYAYTAAVALKEAGKYMAEEIGVLIDVTQNPDYRTPSTASALHMRLGLDKSCLVFDVNLGCSGFVYGVSLAASLLTTSNAKKALVLVGDSLAARKRYYCVTELDRAARALAGHNIAVGLGVRAGVRRSPELLFKAGEAGGFPALEYAHMSEYARSGADRGDDFSALIASAHTVGHAAVALEIERAGHSAGQHRALNVFVGDLCDRDIRLNADPV